MAKKTNILGKGGIDYNKYADGLVPAIVQDFDTCKVLMLGFMNEEAFIKTEETGKVTFYSRSKKRLWTKGEESGNFLMLKSVAVDCDYDTLLIKAHPLGPVCHTGADTCWSERNHKDDFLYYLEDIINLRKQAPAKDSYVASLFAKGINKIAQKVGEEAIEMVIEAKDDNEKLFLDESADLLFHYLVLLNAKGYKLQDVIEVLKKTTFKMMRIKFLLAGLLLPVAIFAQTTGAGFVIEGKITSLPNNALVMLSGFSGTDTIAKARVVNGAFVLRGKLPSPDVHLITFPSIEKRVVLFMGNDHVNITGDTAHFGDIKISGAPANYEYEEFIYHIKPLNDYVEYYRNLMQSPSVNRDSVLIILNAVYNIYQQSVDQFLVRKSNSPVAALLLAYSYDTDPNKNIALLENRLSRLTGDALKSQFASNIQQVIATGKIAAVGTKAPDFTQNDTTGKPVSLSQFKGKYVLVDFWASWCRPCRAENPNVVAAYNAFKDKNFTILSVSLDQRKENWLYAIKADNLTWNHVSDLQYWSNAVARTYHVESIPANFLVDPNGNIIAKNLRGEELAQRLSELIK